MGNLLWGFIAPVSILVPLLIAIARFRQLHPALKIILYYLLFAGIINVVSILLAKNRQNNMPLAHLFTYGEMVLLLIFYSRLWSKPIANRFIMPTWIAFTLFFAVNILFFQSLQVYNSVSRSVEAFIMLVYCIVFFYGQLNDPGGEDPWYSNPFLWVVMGLFLYFSGALFLFIFSELISRQMIVYKLAWSIHAWLVILMYGLFAVSFFQSHKYTQYETNR